MIRQTKSLFCRYERLLRRAKTEDLTEVSGIGCLYQSGVDRQGRPVVVFVGKWFPATKINLDKVKTFACALKINVATDYVPKKNLPLSLRNVTVEVPSCR